MCLKCSAPEDRYYVQDRTTGLIVCEECGFAYDKWPQKGVNQRDYIWVLNPEWPEFHSFKELFHILVSEKQAMPGFRLHRRYPSRLFTAILELLHTSGLETHE